MFGLVTASQIWSLLRCVRVSTMRFCTRVCPTRQDRVTWRKKAMPFTNTEAAAYGLLAMYAMDMYRVQEAFDYPQFFIRLQQQIQY
jgi:hypothetical protein